MSTDKKELVNLLKKVFGVLKQIEPIKDDYDIIWDVPHYIMSKSKWYPCNFVLYDQQLYCRVFIGSDSYDLSWKISGEKLNFESGMGTHHSYYFNDESFWLPALRQVYKNLQKALKNPVRYNRWIVGSLPKSCRTGKLERHYTWEKGRSPFPLDKIFQIKKGLNLAEKQQRLKQMTLSMYLKTTAIAYDAGIKELRPLSPLKKYQKRADGRHGGLLDLPKNDPVAFEKWYHSGRWAGSHPWEIIFGHPHGIMLAPHHDTERNTWQYVLWVDSEGWYITAALMALALAENKIPFEFRNGKEVQDALAGIDAVEIGPSYPMLSLNMLRETRKDSVAYIRWDPIHQIKPISQWQKMRLKRAIKGSRFFASQ